MTTNTPMGSSEERLEPSEENWYIVKRSSEACEILSGETLAAQPTLEKWGPFKSQNQAIAKRVGLIRAGKCRPV